MTDIHCLKTDKDDIDITCIFHIIFGALMKRKMIKRRYDRAIKILNVGFCCLFSILI